MKLSNQQVQALTDKIYNELNKDVSKQYSSDMADIEKKFKKTKEYAAMILINQTAGYQLVSKGHLLARMYDLPKNNINALKKDITNEIILSTIDCDNLDELIAKVKASVSE